MLNSSTRRYAFGLCVYDTCVCYVYMLYSVWVYIYMLNSSIRRYDLGMYIKLEHNVYIYICIHLYIHTYIYKYLYIYMYIYMYIYICICICIFYILGPFNRNNVLDVFVCNTCVWVNCRFRIYLYILFCMYANRYTHIKAMFVL
jgi:hypothetical protein